MKHLKLLFITLTFIYSSNAVADAHLKFADDIMIQFNKTPYLNGQVADIYQSKGFAVYKSTKNGRRNILVYEKITQHRNKLSKEMTETVRNAKIQTNGQCLLDITTVMQYSNGTLVNKDSETKIKCAGMTNYELVESYNTYPSPPVVPVPTN